MSYKMQPGHEGFIASAEPSRTIDVMSAFKSGDAQTDGRQTADKLSAATHSHWQPAEPVHERPVDNKGCRLPWKMTNPAYELR